MTRPKLPEESALIRTDYTDDGAWNQVVAAAQAPQAPDGFMADLTPVNDPSWDGITVAELLAEIGEPPPYYVFIVDRETLTNPEHPILVIDISGTEYPEEHGQTVRVIPSAMWSIENNLSLANMDFIEFVESADDDGIFRRF